MSINEKFLIEKGINQIWAFNRVGVEGLTRFLYEDTFLNNIKLLFSNPVDNVLSFRIYPFSVPVRTDNVPQRTPIKIGNVTSGVYAWEGVPQYTFTAFDGYIERYYNNFMDFSPYTKIEIYIPYISGVHEIDCDEVIGKKLKINYSVDFYTGKCIAYLLVGDEETLLTTYDGQIGVDVQIGGGADSEIARNLLSWGGSTALSVGATIATHGALAPTLISSSLSGLSAMKHTIQKRGTTQPFLNFMLPQDIIIYITRPRYIAPSNYNSVYGLPLNEERQLSTLNGFTKISEIHLENLESATLEEIREIKRLLSEGVILSGDSTEFMFTVNGETYTSTGATTWETWVNTIYNTGDWFIKDMRVARVSGDGYEIIQGAFVDDYIQPIQYLTHYEVNTFTFYINGVPYSTPYNFTWVQWVNSIYNDSVNRWYIEDNQIRRSILFGYEYISGSPVSALITPNDIINNVDYETTEVLTEISFTIDSYPYIVTRDTTWREWVNSPNNENSIYKIWNNKIYRMESNIIRVVEGVGGIEVTPDDTIESFDYTTGTLSTLTFTLFNLDSTTSTYTATTNTVWNDWLSSPYSALKFTRINNSVCVIDSSLQPHKVLKDINAEPQMITDIVEATTYSVDSNIYT